MIDRLALGLAGALLVANSFPARAAAPTNPAEPVAANDNTNPAGILSGNTLQLSLRAGEGVWRPEGAGGAAVVVEAFGETSSSLMVPAPLIRVRAGTAIAVSIRNDLGSPLRVNGLCGRDGSPCAPIDVPPSQTREVEFSIRQPGTYHYWATSMGAPVPFRELGGALIVDPAEGVAAPDRVLVITEWTSLTQGQLRQIVAADDVDAAFAALRPRFVFTINGLSWPATERFTHHVGDTVRWRVINLSSQAHPLHLHGFYFEVDRLGDGMSDAALAEGQPRRVVTQLLPSGGTLTMTWVPEREGNWLFHCHVMTHISPERRFDPPVQSHEGHGSDTQHADHLANGGMAGMLVGISVIGRDHGGREMQGRQQAARTLTLEMKPGTMGAPLVLRRGEPVEVTVVNRLAEPTTVHWHGIEVESFYDGVHGWSGHDRVAAPLVQPGATFIARFTPPRTGTFIYHTHLHDVRQLSSGLYGPLIVTEPDDLFDPVTDHALVIGRSGLTSEWDSIAHHSESAVLNGERAPQLVWKAGVRNRLRLINITPDDILSVCLQSAEGPLVWTPLSKDGAALEPAAMSGTRACQTIAVGETYDFAFDAPTGRRSLWLDVRTTSGKWQVQGRVTVR